LQDGQEAQYVTKFSNTHSRQPFEVQITQVTKYETCLVTTMVFSLTTN
jgi:hypothetical protein